MKPKTPKVTPPIKMPDGWRSTRKSGSRLYDAFVPMLLAIIALGTIVFLALTVGAVAGWIRIAG